MKQRPGDFSLGCLYVETLGQIGAVDSLLIPAIDRLTELAGTSIAKRVRVVKLIEAMPEGIRPLTAAGDIIERGMAEAETARAWDDFWGWTLLEDERLALDNDTASRLKLWEYPLRRNMPIGRLRKREARARIYDLEDADLIREEALKFWTAETNDPRADWPADAGTSAAADRLACFTKLLRWQAPGAEKDAGFAKLIETYAGLVLACPGAERQAALNECFTWLEKVMVASPELRPSLNAARRDLCQKIIANPKAAGGELLTAGEGLMACLKSDLDTETPLSPANAKADPNSAIAEQVFAAVIAFDRADKTGTASGVHGLQAVLYGIQVSGEDPDVKLDRAARYHVLYDFARLLADKTYSLEAANLFMAFKAAKMQHWQATQEILTLAAKQQAPAATVAALIAGETWPAHATGDAEALFATLDKAYAQEPGIAIASAGKLLALNRWNAAAGLLAPLAALKPTGKFTSDVATAQALLTARSLATQLPAEVEAVLAAAFTVAPADSFTRNDTAQALCDLQYAQGDVAAAQKTLQAWWDSSITAQALSTAMQARVKLTLVQERDLDSAQALYTALRARLPGDPVSRLAVLKEMLRALADGGATQEYTALANRELQDATLPPAVRVDLLMTCADEAMVQGNTAAALDSRSTAFVAARAAGLAAAAPGSGNPTSARASYLRGILDRMQGDVQKFPRNGDKFEKALVALTDPPETEPVVGRALCVWYRLNGRAKEATALVVRLAVERPWDADLNCEAAQAAAEIGDKSGAIARYRTALALHPGDIDPAYQLLFLGLQTGDQNLWREMLANLREIPGRYSVADYAPQLVDLGHADIALALIADQQQATGQFSRDELRFLAIYWMNHDHFDRALQMLAQFAVTRARQPHRAEALALIGDLSGMVDGWNLQEADRTALPEMLGRVEQSILPAAPGGGGAGALTPGLAEQAAIRELRVCRADFLMRGGKVDEALALLDVTSEADFDALILHYATQPAFRAVLCEKVLQTPPVGAPSYEIKLHVTLAMAYEQSGENAKVLAPFGWLVEHCKPAEKKDWQEHFARLLLSQNHWQEALALYQPIAREKHSWTSAVAVWRILRDHPEAAADIDGKKQTKDDFILSLAAATPGRTHIQFHRDLAQQMRNQGNLPVAESLARLVLAECHAEERTSDRYALLEILQAQANDVAQLELLDAEAAAPMHRAGLDKMLPRYMELLRATKRFNREAILGSAYLQRFPAADVWTALVSQSGADADHWAAFLDLGLDARTTWSESYFTTLLRYGQVDEALQGLLETTAAGSAADTWGLFKQPDWRQAEVVQILGDQLPEVVAAIEERRAKALGLNTLDGARAALHRADVLAAMGAVQKAADTYASLPVAILPVDANKAPVESTPASLKETIRAHHFQFLISRRCDLVGAAKLLPLSRRPGSLALRQTLWNQWRAAGRFRECLSDVDAAMKAEGLREMSDELRRSTILDLLGAAAESATPSAASGASAVANAPGGSQFRNQAFQLALEALRRSEMALRRGEAENGEGANAQRFDDWLYILVNVSRYDATQRADLTALLWNLAQSEPAGADRVARAILTTAGDKEGYAGRLTAVDKLIEIHAGAQAFKPVRLALLRRLKRQDEVVAALRESLAAAPEDLEARYSLAMELKRSESPALQAEAQALLGGMIGHLDPIQPNLLTQWARRMERDGHLQAAERLYRMAWMASPVPEYAQNYAQFLRGGNDAEEATRVILQSLFVREWRTREGQTQFQETLLPPIGQVLVQVLNDSDAYRAAIPALDGALVNAVSPRHRAQLNAAKYELY
ncbi:MAG TPA: hypothetical protein VL860_11540, partial [Planctomycetota bacterium]|nr:hypothetical protein [Planctomycetota bacterium]